MPTPIISVADLRISARKPNLALDDPTAVWVVEQASAAICDYANRPSWEDEFSTEPPAPRAAKRVALAVATRVFLNPQLERSSSIGPLSSSYHEHWALGFNLADVEKEIIDKATGAADGGNWLGVMTLAGSRSYDKTLYLPDESGSDWHIPYFDTDDVEAFREPDDVEIPYF